MSGALSLLWASRYAVRLWWQSAYSEVFSQNEYGIFSLAWVILNIAAVIATLGFQQGAARQIAYYRGKTEAARVANEP